MKTRNTLLIATMSAWFVVGAVAAQDVPAQQPVGAPVSVESAPAPPQNASYPTPQGELTARSAPAAAPMVAPPPPFAELSGRGKAITEDQAAAYPPLANDFIHADSNRNGTVSASEYARWSHQAR